MSRTRSTPIYVCDRCEAREVTGGNPRGWIVVRRLDLETRDNVGPGERSAYDLCASCAEELSDWLCMDPVASAEETPQP
jgi:hypothetical protein